MLRPQIVLIGWFSKCKYDNHFDANVYNMYTGIALMMLVGFGYLMAFLKKYGLGAVGFTFVLTCLCVQLNIVLKPLIPDTLEPVISMASLIDGNFAAATILISFGCIIGKVTPAQLVVMTVIESIFFQINANAICYPEFDMVDTGGTIVIHTFGAYFGLAVAMVLGLPNDLKGYGSNSFVSDLLSLIGTVFLWLYWPSFNGGAFINDPVYGNRCMVNTVVSLCASCLASFIMSGLLSSRFQPADVQNASLAGGVGVGAICHLNLTVAGSAGIGMIVGAVSVFGYQKVQPFLLEKIGLHDSCGVHNLHGLPGLIGSIISAVVCVTIPDVEDHIPHSGSVQAVYQMYCLGITLAISIASGILTGFILKFMGKCINSASGDEMHHFTDSFFWQLGDSICSPDMDVSKHDGSYINTAQPAAATTAA